MNTSILKIMKKYLLVLVLLGFAAKAQTLSFADPQLKSYLLSSNFTNAIAMNNSNTVIKLDVNSNGEIETSEAALVGRLWIENAAITNLGGIEGFPNLTQLDFKLIGAAAVTLVPMPNLQKLQFLQCASLTSVNATGMTGMTQISCTGNPLMTSVNLTGCTSLTDVIIRNTAITSFDVSGNTSIVNLFLDHNQISSINLAGCSALTGINIENNLLTSFDISGLTSVSSVLLDNNPPLTTINAAGCTNLVGLSNGSTTTNNQSITSIDLTNCSSFAGIQLGNSSLATLKVTGCSSLTAIIAPQNQLTTLDVTGCNTLVTLSVNENQLTSLNLGNVATLEYVNASTNQISNLSGVGANIEQMFLGTNQLTTVDLSNRTQMTVLQLGGNIGLADFNISGCSALTTLGITPDMDSFTDIDISGCSSLATFSIPSSPLQYLNVQGCTALTAIQQFNSFMQPAPLTTLDLSGLSNLNSLVLEATNLNSLNLTGCTGLTYLWCTFNPITSIDLSDSPDIATLMLSNTMLQTLDVSAQTNLTTLRIDATPLQTLYAKNGSAEAILATGTTSLTFVCQDEFAIASTVAAISSSPAAVCNSYCSFTPGGDYNTITGTIRYDLNNNGCDAGDLTRPNIRIDINDGATSGASFTNNSGNYTFYTEAGNFDLTPNIENPTIFNVIPATATVSFPDDNNNIATQDFCITANGIHNDVEIVIAPIIPARPGFVAYYSIVIKNKGNQTLSGNYSLAFEDDVMNFVSADITPDTQNVGLLGWNYTNLLPFESRVNYVLFNVNSPTQTPAVNIGDVLDFTAVINPISGDFTMDDNVMTFNQVVVGSYDPNDITCIEGDVVPPAEIGNYLHYIVNFENTGTAAAENVVVRIDVDPAKYDIGSLQMLNTSHQCRTLITGDKVEFIFEGINLGVDSNPPVGGHGNVLFKIKSDNNLIVGDHVNKRASIFFDYNAPVETLPADTVFQQLSNPEHPIDQSIVIYPNPAKNYVNITSAGMIEKIELFDIQGRILSNEILNSNMSTLDISGKSNGIYFLRITSDKGQKVEKVVKH